MIVRPSNEARSRQGLVLCEALQHTKYNGATAAVLNARPAILQRWRIKAHDALRHCLANVLKVHGLTLYEAANAQHHCA